MRHSNCCLLIAGLVSLGIGSKATAEDFAAHPNIITVFVDDMGWQDLSCFGGTGTKTVNIDRLASEGLRFTNFYVNSPICSPSRTALTTGHYPARHRITSYLAQRKKNDDRGIAQWLDVNAPTLPRMLSDAGYATGHFGKWHMGGQRDVGEAPLIVEYGFDASLTNFEGLGPRILPLCDNYDGKPLHRHDLGSAKLGRGSIEWENRSLITARFVKRSVEFIDEAVEMKRPFYVNVWPDDVHSPFFPPQDRRGDGTKRSRYLGVLKTMDEQLGVLFDRIRNDEQLLRSTVILLASDNGHEPGAGSGGPLRGEKTYLYEGGIRSPLIVWAPGLMESTVVGTSNDSAILSSIDLVVAMADLADVTRQGAWQPDGEDMLDVLLGRRSSQRRVSPLYWRRPPDRPGTTGDPNPDLAIRDGKWKLLCSLDGSDPQLYNLTNDIGEATNLVEDQPETAARLTESLLKWNSTLPVDGIASFPPR